jgi:hypothetical protein
MRPTYFVTLNGKVSARYEILSEVNIDEFEVSFSTGNKSKKLTLSCHFD